MLRTQQWEFLEVFSISRPRVRVTHNLQMTPSFFFFSQARLLNLQNFKLILMVLSEVFGLKINLDKSTLLGINMNQDQVQALASLLDNRVLE